MKYLAILKDSLVETLDRKSLYVMFALAAFFILLCASVSFTEMDARASIASYARDFEQLRMDSSGISVREFDTKFEIGEVKAHSDGEYEFPLTVTKLDEFTRLVRTWDANRQTRIKKDQAVPNEREPIDDELAARYLRARFRELAMDSVEAESSSRGADTWTFSLLVKPYNANTLMGAHRAHVLFGAFSFHLKPPFSKALFLFLVQAFLSEWVAGLGGIAVAIIFTAGFVPNMMQKGTLDVLLARPVRRTSLLLLKYVGGLTYGLMTAAVFIGGSWLVLSARSGIWNFGYLATAGTLVFFFAVIYSVGVFFATWTRSTIAAIVMPLVLWAISSAVNAGRNVLQMFAREHDIPRWIMACVDAIYYVLPKPSDINEINNWLMARGSFGEALTSLESTVPMVEVGWTRVVVSSVVTIVVMLGLACAIFSRRDH
jgi:ABC-type transport system involved in multi-copper enzyme maturation permease subunit